MSAHSPTSSCVTSSTTSQSSEQRPAKMVFRTQWSAVYAPKPRFCTLQCVLEIRVTPSPSCESCETICLVLVISLRSDTSARRPGAAAWSAPPQCARTFAEGSDRPGSRTVGLQRHQVTRRHLSQGPVDPRQLHVLRGHDEVVRRPHGAAAEELRGVDVVVVGFPPIVDEDLLILAAPAVHLVVAGPMRKFTESLAMCSPSGQARSMISVDLEGLVARWHKVLGVLPGRCAWPSGRSRQLQALRWRLATRMLESARPGRSLGVPIKKAGHRSNTPDRPAAARDS